MLCNYFLLLMKTFVQACLPDKHVMWIQQYVFFHLFFLSCTKKKKNEMMLFVASAAVISPEHCLDP